MKKIYLFLIVVILCFSGCGLLGGGETNTDANANAISEDDPGKVPEFKAAEEAVKKGDEYLEASLYKMAINAFSQAIKIDPDLAEAHFKLGVAYSLNEKETGTDVVGDEDKNSVKAFKNAVRVYKRYVKGNPEDAEAYFNLGRAHAKLFEDTEAASAMEKAVKLEEENGLFRTELGSMLIKLARYPEAIKQLQKAIEIDEDNIRAEELLEKAQAGKQREVFRPKDTNSNSDSNSNTEPTPAQGENAAPTPPASPKANVPPPPPLPKPKGSPPL